MEEISVALENGREKMSFVERSCNTKRNGRFSAQNLTLLGLEKTDICCTDFDSLDPKTSIDIKIESNEAYICTLDECNDKIVSDAGLQNALNLFIIFIFCILI